MPQRPRESFGSTVFSLVCGVRLAQTRKPVSRIAKFWLVGWITSAYSKRVQDLGFAKVSLLQLMPLGLRSPKRGPWRS